VITRANSNSFSHVLTGQFYSSMANCKATTKYEGWNFNSGNYLFTTDTK